MSASPHAVLPLLGRSALAAVVAIALVVVPVAADPGDDGAPADDPATGPDEFEAAAAANTEDEVAAGRTAPPPDTDTPIVARQPARDLGLTEDDAVDALADTAPGTPRPGRDADQAQAQLVNYAGTTGASCNYATLEDAVFGAAPGSTIYVAPGMHAMATAGVNLNVDKDLDIVQGTATCGPSASIAATNVVLTLAPASALDSVIEVYNGAEVRLDRITVQGGNSAEGTVYVFGTGTDLLLDRTVIRNGDNPSASAGGGGLRIAQGAAATMVNGGAIANNTAVNGGGVHVDGGTFTIADLDNVEFNTASNDGGGIHAINGARVNLRNDADVLDNTATEAGGGVYLAAGSVLDARNSSTNVLDNTARLGGGVYAIAGSFARVTDLATVGSNSAGWGGGVYLFDESRLRLQDLGSVTNNTAANNGGGILASTGGEVEMRARGRIANNEATNGGGLYMLETTTLDLRGGASSSSVGPAMIASNTAAADGGGLFGNGISATLDTVHLHDNQATRGGGLYLQAGAAVTMTEATACKASSVDLDEFCSEVRGNVGASSGGAVHLSSSTFRTRRTGLVANVSPNGAAIRALGDSSVDLRASMVLGHDDESAGDGAITLRDTSHALVIGVTAADNIGPWMDMEGAATTAVVRRSLVTSNLIGDGSASGSCNMQAPGASGTPGAVTASPRFAATSATSFALRASSAAVDACKASGSSADVFGTPARNGDGWPSNREFDRGAVETSRGFGLTCRGRTATRVGTFGNDHLVGTNGPDVIVGLGGNDLIDGRGGHDRICGQNGNDTLLGRGGNDLFSGGNGRDEIRGNDGADRLQGNGGNDRMYGNAGNDRFDGGGGFDRCGGGPGTDIHNGGCEVLTSIP